MSTAAWPGGAAPGAPARARALGLPDGLEIEPAIFDAGLALLRERHGLAAARSLAPLLRAGNLLWSRFERARVHESLASAEADEVEAVDESWRDRPWDAERVAEALEAGLVRGAHLLRRAHLLCQIAEATVVLGPDGATARRLLVIEGGRVTAAADAGAGDLAPVPPGARRAWRERQDAFARDGGAYDRCRVLVTELRRLVVEDRGRPLQLRLGAAAALDRRALARRLRWV